MALRCCGSRLPMARRLRRSGCIGRPDRCCRSRRRNRHSWRLWPTYRTGPCSWKAAASSSATSRERWWAPWGSRATSTRLTIFAPWTVSALAATFPTTTSARRMSAGSISRRIRHCATRARNSPASHDWVRRLFGKRPVPCASALISPCLGGILLVVLGEADETWQHVRWVNRAFAVGCAVVKPVGAQMRPCPASGVRSMEGSYGDFRSVFAARRGHWGGTGPCWLLLRGQPEQLEQWLGLWQSRPAAAGRAAGTGNSRHDPCIRGDRPLGLCCLPQAGGPTAHRGRGAIPVQPSVCHRARPDRRGHDVPCRPIRAEGVARQGWGRWQELYRARRSDAGTAGSRDYVV